MEIYTFENNILTLIDSELNLSIQEPFNPIKVPESKCEQSLHNGHSLKVVQQDEIPIEAYVEKQGQLNGQYLYFYPSGVLKMELFYCLDRLHGPSTFYSETETILSKSWYIQGEKQGKSWWYYSSGALYSLQRFCNGKSHGKQEYYFADGTLKTLMIYSQGKMESVQLS